MFVFTSRFRFPLFVVSGTPRIRLNCCRHVLGSQSYLGALPYYVLYIHSHSYRVLNLLTLCIVTSGHLTTLICKWSRAYVSESVCLFRFCSLGQRDLDQMMDCGVPIYWHWSERSWSVLLRRTGDCSEDEFGVGVGLGEVLSNVPLKLVVILALCLCLCYYACASILICARLLSCR